MDEAAGRDGGRTALVVGATGLVGGCCVDLLLANGHYNRVHTLVRRPGGASHPKLTEHVVDFEQLDEAAAAFAVDDVFCCLGTTIAKAGSEAAFRRVDLEYPVAIARRASTAGAAHFLLVTAMGADAGSRVFYNRTKGEVEAAVRAVSFRAISIFRPALLLGDRDERRSAEEWAKRAIRIVAPLLVGPLFRYRGIEARTVARAMVRAAEAQPSGVRIYESDEIAQVGR